MSSLWFYTLASVFVVSIISLVGILALSIKESLLKRILIIFVSFSAGALLGDAFIHLLPEIVEERGFELEISLYVLSGILMFFVLEKLIYWRHCHILTSDEHVHTFTYMNLIGDGIHNFIDGMIIAGSYMVNISLGAATTIAVILHEVPQEMGDFGILVYGGFSKSRALFFNFICALTAILGAVIGYILAGITENVSLFLIAFTAGGFIYIAAADLLPELHKQKDVKRANIAFGAFILGLVFMTLARFIG